MTDPYFAGWKCAQKKQLLQIREGLHPLPVNTVPLFGEEVLGLDSLRRLASAAFGEADPTERLSAGPKPTIERTSSIAIDFPCRFPSQRTAKSG